MDDVPAGEPEFTIHGACWEQAWARVGALPSAQLRREHRAILAYLERGWAVLRPLQLEAEAIMALRDRSLEFDERVCVGDFVEVSVSDVFRDLSFTCRDAVGVGASVRTGADMADEAEVVLRALRVLGMAADSPEFPAGLRGCAVDAVEGFRAWMPGLRPLLAPLDPDTPQPGA